jgi:hypothetical protein
MAEVPFFTGIDIVFLRILKVLPKLSLCSFPERPVTGLALALAVGLVPLFGFPVKYLQVNNVHELTLNISS